MSYRTIKITVGVGAFCLAILSIYLVSSMSSQSKYIEVGDPGGGVVQITKDTMHQFLEPRHRDLAHALGQRRVGDDNSGRGLDVSDIPSGNINRIDPDPDAIAKMDRQWFNVLYNAPIKSVALLSSGLSQKWQWVAELEGGLRAVVKPCEDPLYMRNHTTWDTLDYYEMPKRYGTRTGRMDQGMGEIAGFHLDRALGLNRKPPVVGRMVSSKILFRDTDVGGDQSYDPDKDPEWFIPVAMVAYMDSLKLYVPPKEFGEILRLEAPLPRDAKKMKYLTQVSDAIMFDFLSDDHDRKRTHGNWMLDGAETLLLWDSGIAWLHGPAGKEDGSCKTILCGPDSFLESIEGLSDTEARKLHSKCTPTCRYSQGFVEKLYQFKSGDETLGKRWMKLMNRDPLKPVFENYAKFYWRSGSRSGQKPVHFREKNFIRGMDHKVKELLHHIEGCQARHGDILF